MAKGVLHRHFADFDAFLADYLIDRARRVAEQDERLRARAGQGDPADNLAEALTDFFGSVARHVLALVTFRDGLRARLRAAGVPGLPVLTGARASWPATSTPSARSAGFPPRSIPTSRP